MRDYALTQRANKPTQSSPQQTRRSHAPIVFLLIALLCALSIGFFIQHQRKQAHHNTPPTTTTPKKMTAQTPPKREKPVFDFYTVLPEQKVQIAVPATEQAPTKLAVKYTVQVASYDKHSDAERMKDRLILLGFSPTVTETNNHWFRVDVGPTDSAREASAFRQKMQKNGIIGSIIRRTTTNPADGTV